MPSTSDTHPRPGPWKSASPHPLSAKKNTGSPEEGQKLAPPLRAPPIGWRFPPRRPPLFPLSSHLFLALSTPPLPLAQLDCAQACADTAGCSSYQYCGYGSYTDTCLFVTPPAGSPAPPAGSATTAQAAKGECFLGSGHWRQVPTDKPFGGWTVGIACSSIAADPVPVGGGGEEGGGAAGEEAPGAEPVAAVPVLVAAPAAKAAPALAEKAAPAPAPAKKAPAAAAAPAKKPAPAPAGAPAWAAALAATGPIKPMAVPSAVEKAAAVVPPPAPRAELTTASIKA